MTNFDQAKHPRTQAGTSKGGQFTPKVHSAPEVALSGEPPEVRGRVMLSFAQDELAFAETVDEREAALIHVADSTALVFAQEARRAAKVAGLKSARAIETLDLYVDESGRLRVAGFAGASGPIPELSVDDVAGVQVRDSEGTLRPVVTATEIEARLTLFTADTFEKSEFVTRTAPDRLTVDLRRAFFYNQNLSLNQRFGAASSTDRA